MKKNIKVLIHGGLGNQLFMYTAGKSLHKRKPKYNLEYQLNVDLWSKKSVHINFFIEIKNFINNHKVNLFEKLKTKIFDKVSPLIIKDQYSTLDIDSIPSQNYYILDGYFQNYKWYKDSINEVLDEIIINNKKKIFDKYPENELTIVFRRSDYTKLGWELSLDYYFKSIGKLNKDKDKKITIASEDENFSEIFSKFLVFNGYKIAKKYEDLSNNPNSVKDFCAIIKSKNLIMSNSSFCWWGAMIRSHLGYDNKKVICPKFWYPEFEVNLKNSHPGNPYNWHLQSNSFN
jgi:hypothetical protein